ncbi:ferredoxin [Sulfitobacter sp. HNIBRBA3233]|uniref:ferredoxin n=1 Tax=Sulfitobacter marinivivus TaxID=3158558 RepID=UPI0032DFEEF5
MNGLAALCAPHGLMPMGALHEGGRTIALIGCDNTFWDVFRDSPEAQDGKPDPVDRWSGRVIAGLATAAEADDHVFPFGGPPFAPFIAWALASGEAWQSPVGMLVHARAGLMISYRGALVWDRHLPLPDQTPANPCTSCADRPCTTACPVDALSADHGYDVPACKAYLDTTAGDACMSHGCQVRRACPVSHAFDRPSAQSAHHMRYFKGTGE